MRRKASRESCSQTPDDTHSNPVPGHARRSCSTTGKGSQEKGHSPQPPARRGGYRHEGGGPLEAWDERAAGWPWAHAGAQDAASSSWTPGSSGLLTPSPYPSFLVGRHQEKRTSGARIFTQEGRIHRHSYPPALTSPLHLLPQACLLSRGPLLVSLTPDLIPQASMAPYCPEMKSRLPLLASGASHDLTQLTSLHPRAPASSQTFHVGLHQPHGPE